MNENGGIYRRIGSTPRRLGAISAGGEQPASSTEAVEPTPVAPRSTLGLLVQRTLIERCGPPSVVVDRGGRVIYFHGDT